MPNTRLLPWATITRLLGEGHAFSHISRFIDFEKIESSLEELYGRRQLVRQNQDFPTTFPKPTQDPENPANWRSYKYPHDWCTQVAQKQKRISLR